MSSKASSTSGSRGALRPVQSLVWSVGAETLDKQDPRWSMERRLVKWMLHQVTGKCEIQRILDGEAWHSVRMSRSLSKSLQLTRQLPNVRELIFIDVSEGFNVNSVATNIMDLKVVGVENARLRHLRRCLGDLRKANSFLVELDRSRKVKFDSQEPFHTELLQRLWKGLLPGEAAPVGKDWKRVGFQGPDPGTDFRGMGLLSLEALVHFVERNQDAARLIMNLYEELGFAITGINLAGFTLRMFETRQLDHIFFAAPGAAGGDTELEINGDEADFGDSSTTENSKLLSDDPSTVRHDLHDRAVAIFAEQFGHYLREFFSRQWRTGDRNIMNFGIHLATFEARVRQRLYGAT